jgi:hypothetical protein
VAHSARSVQPAAAHGAAKRDVSKLVHFEALYKKQECGGDLQALVVGSSSGKPSQLKLNLPVASTAKKT